MAITIEFVSVIVRKSAAERKYPGGLDGLARLEVANYLEDEHLVRVAFMSTREAIRLAEKLEAAGLRFSDDVESEIAVITATDAAIPPWLSVGECNGCWACWLSGSLPGELIDVDPCMMLRCPALAFPSVDAVVRVLRQAGADVRERLRDTDAPGTVVFDCARETALIEVEVFMDSDHGRPVGVWGRRDLTRRTFIATDVALIRYLRAFLVKSGAEEP